MIILITKTPRINKQSIMPISDNILCYFAIKQINNYMQGESLKLRISQLKKASIELKSKVLTQNKIDIEAVSDILNSILPQKYTEKIVNSHQHSSKDSVTVCTPKSNSQNGGLHSSANSLAYSPVSSIFTTPSSVPLASNINKSAPDRLIIQQRSSSHESLTQSNSIDIQLQKLKRKNQELQNQISAISDDIFNLRKKEKAQQEQEWKDNLPFQYKKGQIGVFITRLFLKQYDFDKIDYQSAKTEIIHDRLLIQMPMKPCRQYKLTNLVEVKYVGDKVVKIDFKIDQTVFVFLQFQTIAQRQSWDLALFVNHKIITNKELDRSLFFQKKQKTDSKDNDLALHFVKKSKSKSSLRFAEDRVDQRTNEQRYLDSKNENFKKGSLKVLEKRTDRSIMSKGSFNSQNKQEESSRYINQFEYTLNGHNQSLENSPIGRESVPTNSDNDRVLKDLIVFGLVGDSHNQSRAHTSKFNLGQANYETQDFGPPNSLPEQSMSLKHLDEDESQRWQGVMNRLKSGYFFTKYARNGMKPHNKHVFISPQEEMLCCVDTFNRNIRKQIPIQNIKRVIYPSIDQGIRKFINNPKTQNYCVIQYSMMGVSKFMQLGCQKVKFISRFASEITEFLRKKGVLIHD